VEAGCRRDNAELRTQPLKQNCMVGEALLMLLVAAGAVAPLLAPHAVDARHHCCLRMAVEESAAAAPSKFVALMEGEDRVTHAALDAVVPSQVRWRRHANPCDGYGSSELTAEVVDPAAHQGSPPREMYLIKGLLRQQEIDSLRARFEDLGSASAATASHARVIVEDGRVVCPTLHALLEPALEGRILPYVRARMGSSRVVVADSLMRAYRQEDKRQALAPHFDVTSYATVIIPLNPGEYEGGLYVQGGASSASRSLVDTSFDKGDALVHRFDVMHGVEVERGDRYSLVLWLSDCPESAQSGTTPWLQAAADAGSPYAQFLYAEALKQGCNGIERDEARAVEYQTRAAEQGHALSQHALGMMFWSGRGGLERSEERCCELWLAAAQAGLMAAQASIGMCYLNGQLGLRDDDEARRWYERAAGQGHAEAAMMLRTWDADAADRRARGV